MPEPMVKTELETGRLYRVDEAPVINRAYYSARPVNHEKGQVLDRLLNHV